VIFTTIGLALAVYTVYGAWSGEVYAKRGVWGRKIFRENSPVYFWIVISIYAALAIALVTTF
jgi:hypothetical protein